MSSANDTSRLNLLILTGVLSDPARTQATAEKLQACFPPPSLDADIHEQVRILDYSVPGNNALVHEYLIGGKSTGGQRPRFVVIMVGGFHGATSATAHAGAEQVQLGAALFDSKI